jgi:hypothetical protein
MEQRTAQRMAQRMAPAGVQIGSAQQPMDYNSQQQMSVAQAAYQLPADQPSIPMAQAHPLPMAQAQAHAHGQAAGLRACGGGRRQVVPILPAIGSPPQALRDSQPPPPPPPPPPPSAAQEAAASNVTIGTVFRRRDVGGTGRLPIEHVRGALAELGIPLNTPHAAARLALLPTEFPGGAVELSGFRSLAKSLRVSPVSGQQMPVPQAQAQAYPQPVPHALDTRACGVRAGRQVTLPSLPPVRSLPVPPGLSPPPGLSRQLSGAELDARKLR